MVQERDAAGLPAIRAAGRTRPRYSTGRPDLPPSSDGGPEPATKAGPPAGAAAEDAVHHLLGELEAEIMGVLWRRGQATVRDVLEELTAHRQLAYTTVMTVMARLAEKGLLRRQRRGKAHRYEVAQTQDEFLQRASRRLVRSLIDDFGEVVMAAMVEEIRRVEPARLTRLQRHLGASHSSGRTRPGRTPHGS